MATWQNVAFLLTFAPTESAAAAGPTTQQPATAFARKRRLSPKQKARAKTLLPQVCTNCGTDQHLTIDHKLARALGGSNQFDNLQMLCQTCNADKAIGEFARAQQQQRLAFAEAAAAVHGRGTYEYVQVWHPTGAELLIP